LSGIVCGRFFPMPANTLRKMHEPNPGPAPGIPGTGKREDAYMPTKTLVIAS
jgi:hypothetical protein